MPTYEFEESEGREVKRRADLIHGEEESRPEWHSFYLHGVPAPAKLEAKPLLGLLSLLKMKEVGIVHPDANRVKISIRGGVARISTPGFAFASPRRPYHPRELVVQLVERGGKRVFHVSHLLEGRRR
jgi:hypothetical protein